MSLGFAFEGSSCRSAFGVGAAQRLAELGVVPDVVAGASSGSVLAAAIATDRGDALPEVWLEVSARARYFQPRRLLRGRWPLTMSHILRGALTEWLGATRLSETTRPIALLVTRLRPTGPRVQVLTGRDDVGLVEAVLGSCFIPGPYSRPIRIGGRLVVDGAWMMRVPAAEALALGADRVIAIVTDEEHRNIGGLFRKRTHPWPPGVRALGPLGPMQISGFDFDVAKHRAAMAMGRESAEMFVRENEAWLDQSKIVV